MERLAAVEKATGKLDDRERAEAHERGKQHHERPQCCLNGPHRKILRAVHEGARDLARDIATTDAYVTSRRERKKVEMLFAQLKRILKLDRLRRRGPNGIKDEFLLAANPVSRTNADREGRDVLGIDQISRTLRASIR